MDSTCFWKSKKDREIERLNWLLDISEKTTERLIKERNARIWALETALAAETSRANMAERELERLRENLSYLPIKK